MIHSPKPISKSNLSLLVTGYLIILIIGIAPILVAGLASFVGECLDCIVNEAATHSCVRWGISFGEVLSSMFMMGWFFLISVPIAFFLFILWTIYAIKKISNKKNDTSANHS